MSKNKFKDLKKEIMYHDCFLPPEEPPVIRFINSGYCVYFRRWIRNLILLNDHNPGCKTAFHSKAAIRKETERHLQYFYNIIHPYSIFKFYWQIFMNYVSIVALFAYPVLSYAATDGELWKFCYVKLALDFFYLLDIIVIFNSGYLNKNTNRVHLHRKHVALNYLKTWFALDLICTINIDLILLPYENLLFYIKLMNYIKVFRIASLIKYLEMYRIARMRTISLYKFNFLKVIVLTLILVFWFTSFLYLITSEYPERWLGKGTRLQKIITCLYRVTYLFFLVGYGEGYSTENFVLIFELACWTTGIIMRFFIIAEIVQIVSKYNAASNKYHQRIQRLKDFMRNKGLPAVTCNRILQYFDFRFQKTFYKEEQILSTLSTQLQREIMLQTCKRFIENVKIFKDMPTSLILKLVGCMKSVIYLPNDVIVQAGSIGEYMYFIYNGTVAVYTATGIEVCHLTDGSNFGEVTMVMKGESRIATVIAVDSCELFVLSRDDFEKAIEPYPDLYNRMCDIAQDRLVKTMGDSYVSLASSRRGSLCSTK